MNFTATTGWGMIPQERDSSKNCEGRGNSQPSYAMKFCQLCQSYLPFDAFYYQESRRSFSTHCKACTQKKNNEYEKQKRLTDRDWVQANSKKKVERRKYKWHADLELYAKILERQRSYAKKIKDLAFAAYGGYVCVCCGESHQDFLTIDHVDNKGAEHRRKIGKGGAPAYRWLKKNNYPLGFQVLCHNCNWSKHINHGTCVHTLDGSTTRGIPVDVKRWDIEAPGPLLPVTFGC